MAANDITLKTQDIAWSESIIYSSTSFGKYNPDDLIGRKGYSIYRKMMLDDQVKAVVLFKRDAITSRDYIFVAPEDMDEEDGSQRVKVFESAVDSMEGTIFNAMNGVMSAMYNGFSLTEKLFKQITVDGLTYWGIDALKIRPFDSFRFNTDEYGNILSLIQEMNNKRQEIDVGDFIYMVNRPDIDDHYGQSELRECYRDWFSKDISIKFRNIWLEKHATGYRWVEPAPDSDKRLTVGSAEYNAIVDMLTNKTAGSGFILPSGYTMRFQFPSNNVAFQETIASSNMAIARSLLVPNLLGISEQGKFGSRALGDDQMEAFFWTLDTMANNLASILNRQLFIPLGEANWGDGQYPLFQFKPVSEKRKHEIISKWLEMVDKGSVRATSKDEDHLRELIEFPSKTDDDDDEANNITALDAQQIAALSDIASKVKSGGLEVETAILLIVHTLPLNREEAEEFINSIEIEKREDDGDEGGDVSNNPNGDGAGDPTSDGNVIPSGGNGDVVSQGPVVRDETVIGRSSTTIIATQEAFSKAVKRVAFAVIAQNTDDITELAAMKLSVAINQGVKAILDPIEDLASVDAAKVVFPGRIKTKLRGITRKALQRGWNLGAKHAQDETDKARGQRFKKIDYERLGDNAEQLLSNRSFNAAGKISDDVAGIIKNIILQGVKSDRTIEDITKEIYTVLGNKGYLDVDTIESVVEVPLETNSPLFAVKATVRTLLFEAINEARYDYFTDPELDDFVEALEYSAILDLRTTQICKELDGKVFSAGSEEWNTYRPPNHHQCRSLLIAVTERDVWEQSDKPAIQPQEGFA